MGEPQSNAAEPDHRQSLVEEKRRRKEREKASETKAREEREKQKASASSSKGLGLKLTEIIKKESEYSDDEDWDTFGGRDPWGKRSQRTCGQTLPLARISENSQVSNAEEDENEAVNVFFSNEGVVLFVPGYPRLPEASLNKIRALLEPDDSCPGPQQKVPPNHVRRSSPSGRNRVGGHHYATHPSGPSSSQCTHPKRTMKNG